MRRSIAVITACCVFLAGCSGTGSGSGEPRSGADAAAEAQGEDGARAASDDPNGVFADVLAAPGSIPVNPSVTYQPTGSYSHAFADFTGDGRQDMLLRVDSQDLSPVIPIRADDGGASAGGQEIEWAPVGGDGNAGAVAQGSDDPSTYKNGRGPAQGGGGAGDGCRGRRGRT